MNIRFGIVRQHGANLLEEHLFQFDFLNDDFSKLPQNLQNIINDPEKCKKLIIYINPPYAEATSAKTVTGTGKNKEGVATNHKVKAIFNTQIGNASNELFALFMAQAYENFPNSHLALFSTLKFIQGTNFRHFKNFFLANYLKGFIAPANTFDNVKGDFPIGFTIWNLNKKTPIKNIKCSIYDENENYLGEKIFYGDLPKSINKWIKLFDKKENIIGLMVSTAPDFQHNIQLVILSKKQERYCFNITKDNLIIFCIYFSVRKVIPATWLNDRDQFLFPNKNWKKDFEFQNDCLAYTLFHGQNRISNKEGTNHWIPFREEEINAKTKFESNFMTDFISGKINKELKKEFDITNLNNLGEELLEPHTSPLQFSKEAKAVFEAGKELWKYYHNQKDTNVNASFYDIRAFFQGRKNGRMNANSNDATYTELIKTLRNKLKIIAQKIEPKVYEYGFLKE